ncbi:MAG: alpha/beta hydrolase fold domain-containing protein [Phycisphaeraceae bacterium]|nr:alpha/beta hydrolase fold domain-containing protein [Phycisphaeraceae bacterium]
MNRFLLSAYSAATLCSAAIAQLPTFNEVVFATVQRDNGTAMQLHIDIYWNNNIAPGSPSPCVVWIHGGAWIGGTHNNVPAGAKALLQSGFVVASVEYRLSSDAIFPAQILDVKGAIRFLKRNSATFRIDPARIATWGSSAGGHLSALALTSNNVFELEGFVGGTGPFATIRTAVDYFGPTDLLNMNPDVVTPPGSTTDHDAPSSGESLLIGFGQPGEGVGVLRANQNNPASPFPEKMRLITLANPISHVNARDRRIFIAHGTVDTSVPIKQSQKLFDSLSAANASPTFLPVPGAGHGDLGAQTDQAAREFLIAELTRCFQDMNRDGIVDDGDFVRFAFSYDALLDVGGDFNGDGVTDDDDFVLFVSAYDKLGCN